LNMGVERRARLAWDMLGQSWVEGFQENNNMRKKNEGTLFQPSNQKLAECTNKMGREKDGHIFMRDVNGLWLVTTPINELQVGDLVRVVWMEGEHAMGYPVDDPQKVAVPLPSAHLFAVHVPRICIPSNVTQNIEPFLVRSPHLVPDGGWTHFLEHAGIGMQFSSPRSWQFYAKCWHDTTITGKTGGLYMSLQHTTRRCQLLIEYGVCGDSLVDTLPHTKQGLLMYISSMNTQSAAESGDVCYESSLSLSFSALLITYAETVSLVRRAVYEHPTHPYGGMHYTACNWDYTHVPYTKPFPVAGNKPTARTLNLFTLARKKAQMWIHAETVACPAAWTLPRQLHARDVHVGMKIPLRLAHKGVAMWIEVQVLSVDVHTGNVEFDVNIPRKTHTLCVVNKHVMLVKQ